MNKAMVLLTGVLVTVSLAGPAAAQNASPSAPAQAAPAVKPPATRHVVGEVVSVNAEARTLTVKRHKGKEITFAVDNDAASALAGLKPGDQVKIDYVRGQNQMLAKTIAKNEVAKAK
ncbi:MAG TPA: hypothetical protein VEL75_19035 [Candidatus Methylomirabilis sp.]|nr:hypothetical protein [Candidatus Methylomirabilis sp.]